MFLKKYSFHWYFRYRRVCLLSRRLGGWCKRMTWAQDFYPANSFLPNTFLLPEEHGKVNRQQEIKRLILRLDWLNLWVVISILEKQQVPELVTGCPQKLNMSSQGFSSCWGLMAKIWLSPWRLSYLCSFLLFSSDHLFQIPKFSCACQGQA